MEAFDSSYEMRYFINESANNYENYTMNGSDHHLPYFGDFFHSFNEYYTPIHGYLSLFVCVFGIISNILNIVVLTRKEMQSATNTILTGLAVADLLVMIDYIPFTFHMYIHTDQETHEKYSYPWALFTLCHAHFSVVLHSISTWLTVILAIWRYTSVSYPTQSRIWCSLANAKRTITLTYFLVPIICFPIYLSFTIRELRNTSDAYSVDWSDLALANNERIKKMDFWLFSVALKLVPCLLLTYLSLALIRVLIEADKRKERLKNNFGVDVRTPLVSNTSRSDVGSEVSTSNNNRRNSSISSSSNNNQMTQMIVISARSSNHPNIAGANNNLLTVPVVNSHHNQTPGVSELSVRVQMDIPSSASSVGTCVSHRQNSSQDGATEHARKSSQHGTHSDRTTRMLLAILILFLVTEMPAGLLALASGIIGDEFFQSVYNPLGNFSDILALVNSGINFILYCSMSRLFRTTFMKIFCLKSNQSRQRQGSPPSRYPPSPSTAIHVLEGPSCVPSRRESRALERLDRRKSGTHCQYVNDDYRLQTTSV